MPFRFNPFTDKLDLVSVSGGGGGTLDSLTGNAGGPVGPDGSNNINVIGAGAIIVTGNPGTNTLTISSSNPFFSWAVIVGNQAAITQHGYFTNGGSTVQVTLPAVSSVGDLFVVYAMNSNGWQVLQGMGQQIQFGKLTTTSGAGGSLASTFIGDTVMLVCNVANTGWTAFNANGNITVV